MALLIRQAGPQDADLIHRFVVELANFERMAHEVEARPDDFARDLGGANPRIFCEIAEWSGEPVGFALWFHTYSTFQGRHGIWLEDLYVSPDHRGQGIGKALISKLAERCREQGLGRLAWWVLDWNADAIGFYRKLGAELMGEWTVCRVSGGALDALVRQGFGGVSDNE